MNAIPFNPTGQSKSLGGTSSSGDTFNAATNNWLPHANAQTNMTTGLTDPVMSPNSNSTIPFSNAVLNPGQGLNTAGLTDSLNNILGNGLGSTISSWLQNGAGFNPAIAQALIAQMNPQIAQGRANIMSEFGAAGAGDSSAAALGLSNYDAQSALNQNSILAQLFSQASQTENSDLMGLSQLGEQAASSGGFWGNLGSILGGVGSLAMGLGSGGLGLSLSAL